uniref:hypothetical protein n=1 Tax=Flavobacterium sp. TaxID=239 RepID=UPI002618C61C
MSKKKPYISPLCSCILCHNPQSAKSIDSHYRISHTEEGKKWHDNLFTDEYKNKISITNKNNSIKKHKISYDNYISNPNKCIFCFNPLEYKSRKNKFCNSSCAAKYNNILRPIGHPSRTKGNDSRSNKIKTYNITKIKKPKYTKIKQCIVCNKWFSGQRKTCSDNCLNIRLKVAAKNKIT